MRSRSPIVRSRRSAASACARATPTTAPWASRRRNRTCGPGCRWTKHRSGSTGSFTRRSDSCRCSPARAGTTTCASSASTTSRRSTATCMRSPASPMAASMADETRSTPTVELAWHKVAELDELPEGRVKTVVAGRKSLALTHYDGAYGALDNHCPHQGGPLGEGSIEGGLLRCPWHGYDYDPITGESPGAFDDHPEAYPVEMREDGVYVSIPDPQPHVRTVSDVLVETMVAWGITHVFGMV